MRWPGWYGLSYFLTRELGLIISLALASLTAWCFVPKQASSSSTLIDDQDGNFLIAGTFFIVGLCTTFKHTGHMYSCAWLLALVGVPLFRQMRPVGMITLLFGWSFCLALNLKMLNPHLVPRDVTAYQFQDGSRLWLNKKTARRVELLTGMLKPGSTARSHFGDGSVLMLPELGGLYFFLGIEPSQRTSWFLPGFVRPYDELDLRRSLANTSLVVVWDLQKTWDQLPLDPTVWTHFLQNPFSPAFSQKLEDRLGVPIRIDEQCWVVPLKPER